MRVERKPEIGDTMFHVCEHLYYVPERAAPLNEYCVCEATVVGFLKGGYTEVKLVGKNPGGFNTPYGLPQTVLLALCVMQRYPLVTLMALPSLSRMA